jgi:dihydrofolate synthase/folylpolyglutamate synthase
MQPKVEECLRTTPYDLPSYSELMTVFGLHYFAEHKTDWAIMEVGCGGRYDSTNILPHKDVAIITNIGLDHAEIIGPTKKDIAYEKAGIINKKSQVFTAEQDKQC